MDIAQLDYFLPHDLIAQRPISRRDQARLMVIDRKTKSIQHAKISQLPSFIAPSDSIILNDTKVIPARIYAAKSTGGKVEVLICERTGPLAFSALYRSSGKLANGNVLKIENNLELQFVDDLGNGQARFKILYDNPQKGWKAVLKAGCTPLPPYIHRSREEIELMDSIDRKRYQTVFASKDGAVAAPTAGLHFTNRLLNRLSRHGVKIAYITLHISPGTFQPIKSKNLKDHRMHEEWFEIPIKTADMIKHTKKDGGKIIAVGTTSCRALETNSMQNDVVVPGEGRTSLYILPGYPFRVVDALLTNFHLPRSTLLALVYAFAGQDLISLAYHEAVEQKYRFYSYGDAMLIL